jgi:hypothetical protein
MYPRQQWDTPRSPGSVCTGGGMKRLFLGLISVLVLAWASLVGLVGWVNAHRIMPSPENETALYQSYDPEQVIKKFRYEGEGHEDGSGIGSSNGIKSIQHNRDFRPRFTMQASRERELVNALREDIILWLRATGANVVTTHDEADGGFTYKYISGNSVGSISVQAPVHHVIERHYPLPTGLDDVAVKIALEERWTRPSGETQWWMAAVD